MADDTMPQDDEILAELDREIEEATSEGSSKPEPEPMDDDEFESYVQASIRRALSYQEELAEERGEALRRLAGEPYKDEEKGRSQYIDRSVQDTIRAIIPSLLRIFFGSDRAVEYSPTGPEDAAFADQATEYVNRVVLARDNPGFMIVRDAFDDALNLKLGVLKWWWEASTEVAEVQHFSGVPLQEWLMFIESDELVEVAAQEVDPIKMTVAGTLRRTRNCGKVRIAAVPPEEFLLDPDARDLESATLVGQRSEPTVSELVEMGYTWDEVVEFAEGAGAGELAGTPERLARDDHATTLGQPASLPMSMRRVPYTELYLRGVDYDGDGRGELRRVCCMGPNYEVVRNTEWDEVPFADLCPDPTSHKVIGRSINELVQDIQATKTRIMRALFDSLAQAIRPRYGVVEGMVRMADITSNDVGAPIRMDAPGMVQPFTVPFVGREALPVLTLMDEIKEARTGQSRASMGLDPDVLQSTTKAAVDMTAQASQQQIAMIAQIFAETGMKRLMRGILLTLHRHQDYERMVRLNNEWVGIQPKQWDPMMDVSINIGLGTGLPEHRAQMLLMTAEKVEALIAQMGPGNPVAGLGRYRALLAKALELGAGIKDVSSYLAPIPVDWQPPPPEPQGPTPEEIFAEAEKLKAQTALMKAQDEAAVQRLKLMVEDNRERDKIEVQAVLKALEIESRYSAAVDVANLKSTAQSAPDIGGGS